ncbi:MAG: DUF6335 family protein [Oscillatoria sp. PMC 1051.18]|nr:DUF6335 family protein [Oscillatoria sp. PMC 1050.18]MEC5030287.1 DUF6335 family protein [Oscillatoria sp. PMC 1051.18]
MANKPKQEAFKDMQAEDKMPPVEVSTTASDRDDTLPGVTSRNTGGGKTIAEATTRMASGGEVTAGDLDANQYQAKVTGDEAVGGLASTPGQNVTEEMQSAMGISSAEKEPVQTADKLERRDENRWQLDPKSSEDYEQHT